MVRLPCLSHAPASHTSGDDTARTDELLTLPCTPILAPRLSLRLWTMCVRLPPDFEVKALQVCERVCVYWYLYPVYRSVCAPVYVF